MSFTVKCFFYLLQLEMSENCALHAVSVLGTRCHAMAEPKVKYAGSGGSFIKAVDYRRL